ncbi:MAG TPA: hypothetical protein VGS60_03665 [Actinomycetes bacterium]|nr:hypothetical protein [Actinomycetes bacterium]
MINPLIAVIKPANAEINPAIAVMSSEVSWDALGSPSPDNVTDVARTNSPSTPKIDPTHTRDLPSRPLLMHAS